jgi:DNA-directed RNA polymerase alpha subunit
VEVTDNTPLSTLGLSLRALRTAEAVGATTVGELCLLSEDRVLSVKGFADAALRELRTKLAEYGRRMEGQWPES